MQLLPARACATARARTACLKPAANGRRGAHKLATTHPPSARSQRIAAMGKPGEKQWLPLESNPEVMDAYVRG
jgi:hypothetical protein